MLLQKGLTLIGFLFLLTSCVPFIYIPPRYPEISNNEPNIIFVENKTNANVKWKKNVARSLGGRYGVDVMAWAGPALLKDGRIYFQNEKEIFVVDSITGDVVDMYKSSMAGFLALDRAFWKGEKKFFPLSAGGYLAVDNKEFDTVSLGCTMILLPANGKLVYGPCRNEWSSWFIVRDFETGNKIWEFKKFFTFYALELINETIVVLYGRRDSLFVELYDINTGKLLWGNQLKLLNRRVLLDNKELWILNELFLTEFYFDKETIKFGGKIISIDPRTGKINWEKLDAARVYIKERIGDDIFYLFKPERPDIVIGVDQKIGVENTKLFLSGFNPFYGISLATSDKLFYPVVSGFVFPYNSFTAIDKKTGNILWTLGFEAQTTHPLYQDGVFYFGDRFNEFQTINSGIIKKYESLFDPIERENVASQLTKTAFAVSAETGEVFWKVKLEGGDEAYIEKLFVKDNMAFIKTLSGWLYAIEWEKPAH